MGADCFVKDDFLPQAKALSLYYGVSETIIKKAYTVLKEDKNG
jgi:DNA-binding transcriptional regulator YhcF (GntR family)